MPLLMHFLLKTRETLEIYWVLIRITIPIAILTELLSRMGAIEAVAPAFAPVMNLVGLPPELGLAWLTAMLVGIRGAVPLISRSFRRPGSAWRISRFSRRLSCSPTACPSSRRSSSRRGRG